MSRCMLSYNVMVCHADYRDSRGKITVPSGVPPPSVLIPRPERWPTSRTPGARLRPSAGNWRLAHITPPVVLVIANASP